MAVLVGCAPVRAVSAPLPAAQRWVAVLVAGDGSLAVFDNATDRLGALLHARGTGRADIHVFSANPAKLARHGVQLASKARVLAAIAGLHPGPDQACLVFMTSHGARGEGLFLAPRDEFITPPELDRALGAGCGPAPTVAIVSGCYTGDFARPPVAQPNRIMMTAAANDRPSFGCGAGQVLTFYDACLLRNLHATPDGWPGVIASTARCVALREAENHEAPSQPQSAVGAAVVTLPPPF